MTEPVPFSSTDQALRILRNRIEQIGITHEGLDTISGLTSGYSSKLLSIPPVKNLSLDSLVLLAAASGYALAFVENPRMLNRVKQEAKNRKLIREKSTHWRNKKAYALLIERSIEFGKTGGQKSAAARMIKLTPAKRRRIARRAAKGRWHRPKLVELDPKTGLPFVTEEPGRVPGNAG